MRVTIAPAAVIGSGDPFWGAEVTLTPGGDGSPEQILFNGQSLIDVVQLLDSATQVPIDRGNEINTITFQYTNQKSWFDTSEQDLILYKSRLPRLGLVRFYAEDSLSTMFACIVAGIPQFQHSQTGITTFRRFTITGGQILTSVPPVPYPFIAQPAASLSLSFQVNVHDNSDFSDFVELLYNDGSGIGVYNNNSVSAGTFGFYVFVDNVTGDTSAITGYVLNTWLTIQMQLAFTDSGTTIIPTVNGITGTTMTTTGFHSIESFIAGARFSESSVNNHSIRAITIGSTGMGSSDLFNCDFSSLIVPPFSSITGTGISISGGAMLVNNAGTDAYASTPIGFP